MSKDVWKDLGFNDTESRELDLRIEFLDKLRSIIDRLGYTQKELVEVLGIKQPEVSNLVNGKVSAFKSERLLGFLQSLNAKVSVKVVAPRKKVTSLTQKNARKKVSVGSY